jgi:homoserine O-succinyltransferase
MQSHPEYGPTSLLREYHRDARRYVTGERDDPPVLPRDCAGSDDWDLLVTLQRRITTGERDPDLVADFPFDDVGARAPRPWGPAATRLYANWLAGVPARSN